MSVLHGTSVLQPTVGQKVSSQRRPVKINLGKHGGGEAVGSQGGACHVGPPQIGPVKVGQDDGCVLEAGAADFGPSKAGMADECTVKRASPQMCTVQIGLHHRGIAEVGIVGEQITPDHAVKHRANQRGGGQPRRLHPRLGQGCIREIGPRQLRAIQQGTRQVGALEAGQCSLDQVEIGPDGYDIIQDCPAQIGTVKAGIRQICAGQIDPRKVGPFKGQARQITAPAFSAAKASIPSNTARSNCQAFPCGLKMKSFSASLSQPQALAFP